MTTPKLTPRWVANVLGVSPPSSLPAAELDLPFTDISTDSRKTRPGSLFVPLKGDRFDAHDFIPAVLTQGARGVLHDRARAMPAGAKAIFFPVADPQEAYRALGAAWRQAYSGPVVMIAGSAGKTTTKELLTAGLRGKWPQVLKTEGSQNGFVGIPMTLLELRAAHGAAVVEVGIDEPGTMVQHVRLVAPSASLLTAIGPEHMEKLIDIETVAREEALGLTLVAESGGMVAVNLDDPWIAPELARVGRARRVLGYGLKTTPDAKTLTGAISSDRATLEVRGGDFGSPEKFPLPLPGTHNAGNLLAAIAMATLLGLRADEIREGLATFSGAEGRSQLRRLGDGTIVLCDYYNSQPASLAAGLELLADTAKDRGRARWACLGDMLELGPGEERYHREAAEPILRTGVENVLLYGPRMRWLEAELRARGFRGFAQHFASQAELASALVGKAAPGSAILIKGSRGMKMEEVWKTLEKARGGSQPA